MQEENMKGLLYPLCGSKTRNRIKEDTILNNYPFYYRKCKRESLIAVKDLQITVVKKLESKY